MRRFGTVRGLFTITQRAAFSVTAIRHFWAERLSRPWMCLREGCRKVNQTRADSCEGCGDKKPVLSGWVCVECETKNHKGVKYCKKCAASADASKDFWCCAACGKANRIDHIEDNSRCGYCEYDMAPLTMTEADAMRIQEEQSLKIKMEQEQFDTLTPKEADEQLGSETPEDGSVPLSIQEGMIPPAPVAPGRSTESVSGIPVKKIKEVPPIAKFTLKKPQAAVSRIGRPKKVGIVAPAGPPGFDWMCREPQCGMVNGGDDEECTSCKTKISPDDWDCQSCAAKNHWSRNSCFACSTPIPVSWQCRGCRTTTSIYDINCRSCQAPRPPVTPRTASDVRNALLGEDLNSKRSGVRRADWYCSSCQQQNFAFRTECFSCGAQKQIVGGQAAAIGGTSPRMSAGEFDEPSPSPQQQRENNWMCRSCNSSNFRTRTTCWQCGKANGNVSLSDDASAPQFEKEGFQLGAEDVPLAPGQIKTWGKNTGEWTCSRCFATNFKNRQECHKCGSVKTTIAVTRKVMAQKPAKL